MSTTTGLIGEYIAAAVVLSLGWRVSLAQQDKVDLVAWNDDGEYLRIQVKTAQLSKEQDNRNQVYHFQFGSGCKSKSLPNERDYDILCCIGMGHRKALFMPIQQVQQKSKRMSPQLFDAPKAELHSFNKSLAAVRAYRSEC